MVNLMEYQPESVLVAQDVPPVKEECAYEPSDQALCHGHVPSGKLEDREMKQANPQPRGGQSDRELDEVHS
jgi:hypothetical protein